jgi:hypothetical protein
MVPPVEIISSTIRHGPPETSPAMWVTAVSAPLTRRLCSNRDRRAETLRIAARHLDAPGFRCDYHDS